MRNYRKDGSMFWNEVSISPIHDEGGRITHFVSFQNDLTDRVTAEQRLRESENLFRTIFEQAAVGVALIETQSGRIVRVNQKYSELIGYTKEEFANPSSSSGLASLNLQQPMTRLSRVSTFSRRL